MHDLAELAITIKEGGNENYFKALENFFNVKTDNNRFTYKKGASHITVNAYSIIPDFEFLVVQSNFNKAITVDRTPDGMPDYYHINIMKEGKAIQDYNNERQYMEAGTPKGIFLYNGLFPLKSNFPANHPLRSISLKISKKALQHIIPEAIDIFDSLFEDDEPKGYHAHLTTEMDRILTDLLSYDKSEFGRTLMVTSKALELFFILIHFVENLMVNNDFHGLHSDDYKRLMLIKEEIINNVETKISMDELAEKYAVSVSKLQRDFKTLFSSSVYQFYTHAKMDEAYRRLKTGQYTVMEVGYDLGYQSVSKFSAMFKKVKGVNPKDVIPV